MDMFRSEVGQALRGEQSQPAPASVAQPAPAPEPPKPSGDATIRGIQHWVNVNYGTGIAEDGYFGPQTKTALVKAYQREVGVTADGIFGPKSKAAAKVIRIGSQGMLTNVGQAILYCLGFDPQGIDGVFGRNTADAALAFQRSRGLGQDAIIGKNTWEALFRG
jgi:peptidoglycan hydrolase-like protein with peptidoglycan-binding domain